MDRIGDFSCSALILFMNLKNVVNPQHVFNIMLKTAEQLADDLEGDLCADPHTPWNESILKEYRAKLDTIIA